MPRKRKQEDAAEHGTIEIMPPVDEISGFTREQYDTVVDEILKDVPLSFESPESSSLHCARYDPHTRQLFVTFKYGKENPTEYRYGNVDASIWVEFVQSKSRGSFAATRIRPFFSGERVWKKITPPDTQTVIE